MLYGIGLTEDDMKSRKLESLLPGMKEIICNMHLKWIICFVKVMVFVKWNGWPLNLITIGISDGINQWYRRHALPLVSS